VDNKLRQTFKKEERLYSRKQIERLFKEGDSFLAYPFKVQFLIEPGVDSLPQILISVPRKNFKRAVDRNKIKRLIRESYRKNKMPLVDMALRNKSIIRIGFVYTAKTLISYTEIERKIILILQRLIEQDG